MPAPAAEVSSQSSDAAAWAGGEESLARIRHSEDDELDKIMAHVNARDPSVRLQPANDGHHQSNDVQDDPHAREQQAKEIRLNQAASAAAEARANELAKQVDAAEPNDEVAMLRQINRLDRPRRENAVSQDDDEHLVDSDDSWLADVRDDQGPDAVAHLLAARAPAKSRGSTGKKKQTGAESEPERLDKHAHPRGSHKHGSESECDGAHHSVFSSELDEDSDELGREEWPEEDSAAEMLSPVSRMKHMVQKMKWDWYDAPQRKPDATGFTELDRRLRRNLEYTAWCPDSMLFVLGGYTGPHAGKTVLRDCERLDAPHVVAHHVAAAAQGQDSKKKWCGAPELCTPRSAFAAAAAHGTVYVLGGQGNDASNKQQGALHGRVHGALERLQPQDLPLVLCGLDG